MINIDRLTRLGVPRDKAADYEGPLLSVMARHDIDTVRRSAAFLAQLIHESNGFRTVEENLNYTPDALMATFGRKRFPPILAQEYGRTGNHPANQDMIAAIAYADRLGNGGVDTLDGWRYRGRGPIQLTGKDNYRRCGTAIGVDLVHDPDRLLEPVVGTMAAGWFWSEGNRTGASLNTYADAGQIDAISKIVNGGTHGLAARHSLYEQALRALA